MLFACINFKLFKKPLPVKVWFLFLITIVVAINCSKKQNTQPSDNSGGTTIEMPRPTDWVFGTWVGTIPPGSLFAGKQVRLFIEKESAPVSGSSVGYNYQGSFTWDYQGSGEWTVNFKNPTSYPESYVWWVYDKTWNIETFCCEIFSNSNHVVLSTTQLGDKGTKPIVMNLYLTANINGISETDKVMVAMSKQ